ncbi:MAG TPA: ABC transporter substrate-binding protein [Stellaceae bacterium]|nr:ABC transporter substrate-binding protein [Stellaceae bacterium]
MNDTDGRSASRVTLDRRQFLAVSGSAAALGLLGAGDPGFAESKYAGQKVVFASWGGAYQDAQKVSFCEAFAEKTGASVVQDGPVSYSKLRVMIEGGAPTWDVVDVTIDFLYSAVKDKLFEKIDTSIVNVNRVEKKFQHEYGVGNIVWSYNIGYNTAVFSPGKHPQSWAEFFDLKRFPGRRSLRDRVNPMLEIALLADGVKIENLYPLDVDRAFKKLDTIKKDAVFWTTNSQSQQLLIDGEAGVGIINNGRIYDAVKKGSKLGIEWNENMQSVDYLVVPTGVKNKSIAMALIDEMTLPEHQAKVAELMALAPTNPDAFKLISPSLSPWLSTTPENAKKGFLVNEEYWKDHYKDLAEKWEAWKLS